MCNGTPQFSRKRGSMCSLTALMINSTKLGVLCYRCSHFRRLSKACACVWWEMVRQTVLGNGFDEGMRIGLASKGLKTGPNPFGKDKVLLLNKSNPTSPNSKQCIEDLKCSHCGNSKHTWDTYFKLHGYSD